MTKKKTKKTTNQQKAQLQTNNSLYGVDEQEFLDAVDKISKKLIYKFKFGYHQAEDMKQQATIFALQGLKFYDKKRPLENFLWTHVRNRLFNYKRDNYQRPDKPCLTCPFYNKTASHDCTKYSDKLDCSLYSNWTDKNNTKKNIMKPLGIDQSKENIKAPTDISEQIKNKELLKKIDAKIPVKHRKALLCFLGGQKIPKKEYVALIEAIKDILNLTQITETNDE
jgi:DNA-directed RNA polymerase specialized sigma24 family protein